MALMAIAVSVLLLAVIAFDVIYTQRAKALAEAELANQKRIAAELEAVMKEQKELETKIANIDARINAIKKLRSAQAGPSAVLEALKERILMSPGLYLESVEQKGAVVTINGNSPDESVVTQFGRSLEFSSGLFSNLNIETQRKDNPAIQKTSADVPASPKTQLVSFKISCTYTPEKAGVSSNPNGAPINANTPQQAPNANQPPQIAKN
jgi:Tfp pilus assembly protein PilN